MLNDLSRLPLAEADRLAISKIEHHRQQMSRWRQARAARIAAERASGRTVADIAAELGVRTQVVYQLLKEQAEPG